MVEAEFKFQIEKLLKNAKRNCLLCYGRARLRPTDAEKNTALKAAEAMYSMFGNRYNELRRLDYPVESIRTSQEYKRICLDALDACKACDKSVDYINRHMSQIK
jgi:predicted ATPase